ncbi:MAG: hypothetical protein LUD69_00260, partial [Oscillospiraceae bacterium]|nr:hypothetical protein [Oscillospiraceae bacterium]
GRMANSSLAQMQGAMAGRHSPAQKVQAYCSQPSPGQHSCPAYATRLPLAVWFNAAVSNFCNALLAEKFRQTPQTYLISASLREPLVQYVCLAG